MKREKLLLIACVLGGIGSLVLGGISSARRVDLHVAAAYGAKQRDARSLQSERSAEILRIHAGTKSHFDLLDRQDVQLRQIYRSLENPPVFLSAQGRQDLRRQAQWLSESQGRATQLGERFKSDVAVLRNSLRYLTVAAPPSPQGEHKEGGLRPSVIALHRLIRAVLLLKVESSKETLRETEARVEETRAYAPDLALVTTHAGIVVARTRSIAASLKELEQIPTQVRSEELLRSYQRYLGEARERSIDLLKALFGFVLFTGLSGAGYVIERLRLSAASLRQSGAQMAAAVERQVELNDLKTSFVSMTSHEFRTPLSRVVSSAEMIAAYRKVWPEEKVDVHLGRIRESATSMTKMLDDILLIGRSEAGMLKFEPRPLSVSLLCAEVVSAVGQGTGAAGRIEVQRSGADEAIADENLLRHVLENLLSNAVKYSHKKVVLRAHNNDEELEFCVKDEGIGVCEADLEHLFDTFHRGSNVGKIPGTGLGLSIVKLAADLHGGSLSIRSQEGQGTEMRVVIPVPKEVA